MEDLQNSGAIPPQQQSQSNPNQEQVIAHSRTNVVDAISGDQHANPQQESKQSSPVFEGAQKRLDQIQKYPDGSEKSQFDGNNFENETLAKVIQGSSSVTESNAGYAKFDRMPETGIRQVTPGRFVVFHPNIQDTVAREDENRTVPAIVVKVQEGNQVVLRAFPSSDLTPVYKNVPHKSDVNPEDENSQYWDWPEYI